MVLGIAHQVARTAAFTALRSRSGDLHPSQKTRMCILPHFHPSPVPDSTRRLVPRRRGAMPSATSDREEKAL
jgi:hypothetical protein